MKQRRIRTYLKVFVNLGMMLAIILGCIFVLPRIIVYFMPFVIGWIIAMIASPLVRFFEKTLKIKRKASSAVVIIAVIALVILLGYLIGAWLIEQGQHFVDDLPLLLASLKGELADVGQKLSGLYAYLPKEVQSSLTGMAAGLQQYAGNFVETASEPTIEVLSRFAQSLPSIIISVIMCLLFTYFYVADRDYVRNLLVKILPKSIIDRFDMIKRSFSRAVGGYFKAQFKIEFWMYFLLAIGFSVLNVKYAFIIAIGVAFLDLLPFFGTGTVLLPWAAIAFISGDYTMVIGLLIMWGVGQLARQIIQPKIVGDSVGLAPIPTIVLLYVGYKAAGVIGMIIAVPIGIIILNMYEEGVFNTTIDSLKVLYAGISNFRHLTDEDMEEIEIYKREEEKRRNK
ncbi:MAG: sporulation integral membrane protein YtvI [Lachnospiraceae bacterium]|nr:sporulation integral membrane protein YtvI [Lachnospiraceae bacterium]